MRRGVKVAGAAEVLVSVYSKAPGVPPARGVVIEAYDAVTCHTTALHVGATTLLRHVDGRAELLEPSRARDTLEALLYRLVVTPSAVGGLQLELDASIMVSLFVDPKIEREKALRELDEKNRLEAEAAAKLKAEQEAAEAEAAPTPPRWAWRRPPPPTATRPRTRTKRRGPVA